MIENECALQCQGELGETRPINFVYCIALKVFEVELQEYWSTCVFMYLGISLTCQFSNDRVISHDFVNFVYRTVSKLYEVMS